MNDIVTRPVSRYLAKISGTFIMDGIKKHLDAHSKEKSLRFINKIVKSKKYNIDLFKYTPKIERVLKNNKDADYGASLNIQQRFYDLGIDLFTLYRDVIKILNEQFKALVKSVQLGLV